MKKEFSFYEFVGIMVPSVTLLFFTAQIAEMRYAKSFIDFSKVGESVVFLIIAYGIGHVLHSIGNVFENLFWKIYGGMPTTWLLKKPRFADMLFSTAQTEEIRVKAERQFKKSFTDETSKDIYNWLSLKVGVTEKRIDVFSANYSMFRGLTVAFYSLSALVLIYFGWELALIPFVIALLSNIRMFRFAKYYAKEVYRTFQNYESQ